MNRPAAMQYYYLSVRSFREVIRAVQTPIICPHRAGGAGTAVHVEPWTDQSYELDLISPLHKGGK
jgi:hypothetical protein